MKTFIVFFDFNKSNLTAEAQTVVVRKPSKTAKSNGMVKVLDHRPHRHGRLAQPTTRASPNAAPKPSRTKWSAKAWTAATISTVGKSFDDPLVPTGPGVREPQNRRAVIELG